MYNRLFLTCAHLGALVLAVNTRFRARELADILGRGGADWLVFWPGFKGIDFQGIVDLSLIHTPERTRQAESSYDVRCLKKKNKMSQRKQYMHHTRMT
ncbi:hypothetical protein HGQ98_34565 [Achromobacter ruhlandii]|uniref:Uncharacterized protein n=1 Tax=Achromobacter ruhlandii TaxID=72557 RepID=A0A848NXJ7_9BURK|nr:hypothetical protein [Achromobacter ruhlandii]